MKTIVYFYAGKMSVDGVVIKVVSGLWQSNGEGNKEVYEGIIDYCNEKHVGGVFSMTAFNSLPDVGI